MAYPVETQQDPIPAFKRALIVPHPADFASYRGMWTEGSRRRLRFAAVAHSGHSYGPDENSVCLHGKCKKGQPDPDCECGFYSYPNVFEAMHHDQARHTSMILEVELLGRVIVCTRGYRAGHQRVLKVYLPIECHACHRPTVGAMYSREQFWPACSVHSDPNNYTMVFTIKEMAQALGTEVAIAPHPPRFSEISIRIAGQFAMTVVVTTLLLLVRWAFHLPTPVYLFGCALAGAGSGRIVQHFYKIYAQNLWKGYR